MFIALHTFERRQYKRHTLELRSHQSSRRYIPPKQMSSFIVILQWVEPTGAEEIKVINGLPAQWTLAVQLVHEKGRDINFNMLALPTNFLTFNSRQLEIS
jgi:hypothetical protein